MSVRLTSLQANQDGTRPSTAMNEQLRYDILEITDNFVHGKVNTEDMIKLVEAINHEVAAAQLEPGTIGPDSADAIEYNDIRTSSIVWLKSSQLAMDVVQELVEGINDDYFNLDISDKPPEYQYTLYKNPNDHYDWHQDFYEQDIDDVQYKRNVSLSLCLSPAEMYEGAELMIKDGIDTNVRVFKMKFGEFVIFPSDVEHRVNALRSGVRASLVVWYGYNLP